jgi:ribulose-5-phosphate 4-epimerase/fuculose-1-phosphate aldolase
LSSIIALIADLVDANHILARHEVLDAYGHVSVRHPHKPDHFLLSRSRAPELVARGDIIEFDLDRKAIGADRQKPYVELAIHSEIYRFRPDVMAVVHSHSPWVVPFSVSSTRLMPVYHMSSFLRGGAPVFDIRKDFGVTDLLVRSPEQGAALAATLGSGNVSLMRGHGFVTVANDLPTAVFQAIYTDLNSRLQQQAIALGGEVTYLDRAEADRAWQTNRATVSRPWELWKKQVRGGKRK